MKFLQDFSFKIYLCVGYFIILLLLFTIARVSVWITYYPIFNMLSGTDTAIGFIGGLLFDSSVICLFCAPVFVLIWLPVHSLKYLKSLHVVWCLIAILLFLVLIADFIYFPEAKRHMAEELLYIKSEIAFLTHYAFSRYGLMLVGVMISGGCLLKIGFWCIDRFYRPVLQSAWKTFVSIFCAVVLVFIGIRGNLTRGKPLSMRSLNALASSIPQGILMSNGVFSAYHTLRQSGSHHPNPLSKEQAYGQTRKLFSSSNEIFVDPVFPLMRAVSTEQGFAARNVFVVLMESWTPRYIDSYGGANYGVTPNFDRIAQGGIQFTNAYAAGIRSVYGLAATLMGVPLVGEIPFLSDGLELNHTASLAKALRQQGYYTAFMQTSLRSSYQMCNISTHILGFEECFGMEDFPKLLNYQAEQSFGYDYDMLMYAAKKAAVAQAKQKPFFIFTFTGTTHTPFAPTTEQFNKYPRSDDENKYLNSLYYADYSIGKLMETARENGWFNNTIFVFMADHTVGLSYRENDIHQKFRIPYVLYAPGLLPVQQIAYPVSQLDLIPTLFHLLHIKEPFAALGVDALNERIPHQAFIVEGSGDNMILVSDKGVIQHNRVSILESTAPKGSQVLQDLERDVLALDKSVSSLFQNNHWMKME